MIVSLIYKPMSAGILGQLASPELQYSDNKSERTSQVILKLKMLGS